MERIDHHYRHILLCCYKNDKNTVLVKMTVLILQQFQNCFVESHFWYFDVQDALRPSIVDADKNTRKALVYANR